MQNTTVKILFMRKPLQAVFYLKTFYLHVWLHMVRDRPEIFAEQVITLSQFSPRVHCL